MPVGSGGVSLSCSGYGDVACFEGGGVSQSDNMTGQKERAEVDSLQRGKSKQQQQGENKTASGSSVRPSQLILRELHLICPMDRISSHINRS